MSAILLIGCGESFAGEYEIDNSKEILTINSDGTCTFENHGVKTACTWRKADSGKYSLMMNTILGELVYDVEKNKDNSYTISAFGFSSEMHKK